MVSVVRSPVSLCHFNATTSSNHNTYESNEIGLDNRVKPTSEDSPQKLASTSTAYESNEIGLDNRVKPTSEDSPQKLASTSTANRIQIISDSCGRFGLMRSGWTIVLSQPQRTLHRNWHLHQPRTESKS
ncbi:hypothetical protein QE152_g33393 [Popillia japonica]|uniref:Uncharacterized protein n=1 Tax=Popillia japonica TaxID=7064 RepID=A0AAW1IXD7_POPJA